MWTLVFLLPVLTFTVRVQFVKSENGVIAKFIYFWLFVPYRFSSQEVVDVATSCSSDDLDKEDELGLMRRDGNHNWIECYGANAVAQWIRKSTGLNLEP
ncbi:MAG: hypothetical protein HYT15_01045 [Candidatus Magasanikbacteria bacterium]|nr:hypothetical protein [Candidatus Magasanikbacteria bacterium]